MTPLPTRARIEEMCQVWESNAADAQERKTLKAALESTQRDRTRLERDVERLRDALADANEHISVLQEALVAASKETV